MSQSQAKIAGNFYDQTFGIGGVVTFPIDNVAASDFPQAIATLPQNKLLMVTTGDDTSLKMVRLNEDGSLDSSFASGGSVVVPTSRIGYFYANSLDLLPDDKFLVSGAINNTVAIVRQVKDGAPDPSFGDNNDGQVSYNVYNFLDSNSYPGASFHSSEAEGEQVDKSTGYSSGVRGVATALDGQIVLTRTIKVGASDFRVIVIRLSENGSLDETFGGKGYVFIASASSEERFSRGVLLQQDGKVLVFFKYNGYVHVIRYNQDGSVDISYGDKGTGIVTIPSINLSSTLTSMALKPDGGVVAAGDNASDSGRSTLLVSLTSDGSFSKDFNDGQPALSVYSGYPNNVVKSLALQDDGRILVGLAVFVGDSRELVNLVARYLPDGSFDTTFGGGKGFIAFDATEGFFTSLAVLPDHRVVFCGYGRVSGLAGHVVRCLA